METHAEHERAAIEYLREALRADAPTLVQFEASFAGTPLEGEGDMSVFTFAASIGGQPEARYWVVAGRTQPNHYPDWGLTPDQVYELHLGTRFMLVMEVSSLPEEKLPDELADRITAFIATVAPAEAVSDIRAAAAFRVEDATYAVCRARIADEEVYVLGLDCPPGIYREAHLPPHVVFRRHLGYLIRREAAGDPSPDLSACQ